MKSLPLSLLLAASALAQADECQKFSGKPPERLEASLEAGEYRIVMVATKGSRKGRKATGALHLRPATAEDRSPRTGQIARSDPDVPLYGWTDLDLAAVGAPMCASSIHPAPDSQDPVYPGVLVHLLGWSDQPENAPTLTIGTLSNPRDDMEGVDGCGIGLFVRGDKNGSFVGSWSEWGVVVDGRGHFCLTPIGGGGG